jgi:iron complex transport system substrate-binding protein
MQFITRAAAVLAAAVSFGGPALAGEVVDQRGVTHRFETPPERVAIIPIPLPAVFMAIAESSERIVAMNPMTLSLVENGIIGAIFPAAREVASDIVQGGQFNPNVETLAALAPDAVFQWITGDPSLIEPLELLGLEVVGFQNRGLVEDVDLWLTMVGDMLDKPERAEAIIAGMKAIADDVRAGAEGIADDERPSVIYFQRFTEGLRPSGAETYGEIFIDLPGGRNAAEGIAGNSTFVNLEQVLAWNPEIILLGNLAGDITPQQIYDDPAWAGIAAVEERRVYRVPLGGNQWDGPSQESPLMWRWMAEIMHPERFEADLPAIVAEHYTLLYGRAPTEDELRAILHDDLNHGSVGYDRYFPG